MAAGSSWQGPRSWLRNRMDNSCRAGNNKCPKKIATIQMVMEPAEPLASKPMDGTKKKEHERWNTNPGTRNTAKLKTPTDTNRKKRLIKLEMKHS